MQAIPHAADTQAAGRFGEVLRDLRNRQGLSLAGLAELTHYSRGHLANVERAVKAPTVELAQTCDEVLGSGTRLQSLVPHRDQEESAAPRPAELPAGSSRFVGREEQLQRLDELMTRHEATAVAVVHGPPGVGKTTLTLHWAQRHVDAFPDGQLFVDLRAYGPASTSADPAAVLEEFLVTLGRPTTQMPSGLAERARLFRSMMRDRRMLVVLDNAASSAQVRPLLPAGPGTAVVITSRTRLEGLVVREGASELSLAPFLPDEALVLLRELLGAERVEAQLEKSRQVASWCGHLPLAVCLAAERIAATQAFGLDVLAVDLAEERARLDTLAAGDDEDTAVRTVFSWSYHKLSADDARLFRLLGLHRGPHISIPAAAALCGKATMDVRRQLESLANDHLVEQTWPSRFRMHDLLHTYAVELVLAEEPEDGRREAQLQMLMWYLQTAEEAGKALAPTHHLPKPRAEATAERQQFASYNDALRWFEEELPNLATVVEQAISIGRHDLAWRIPVAAFEFFHVRKPWSIWERTYRTGLASARTNQDRYGEAFMLHGLGVIDLGHDRLSQARDRFQQALEIWIEIGGQAGEAWTLTGLSQALTGPGDQDAALSALQRALDLHRKVGDEQGEAVSLIFLAGVWRRRCDYEQALACAERAVTLSRLLENPHCEGVALHEMSATCLAADRLPDALSTLRAAASVRERAGDRQGQAETLQLLASALEQAGQAGEAAACLRQALDILQARADPAAAGVRARLDSLAEGPDEHARSAADSGSRGDEAPADTP